MLFFNILSLFSRKNRLFTSVVFFVFNSIIGYSQNYITNGDFESGNKVGYDINGSGYNFVTGLTGTSNPGDYALISDPKTMNSTTFLTGTDHSGTGKMLVIDGNTTGGQQRFYKAGTNGGGVCGLTVGASYTLTYFIKSVSSTVVNAGTQADIGIQFNNAPSAVRTSGNTLAPLPAAGWQKVTYTFTPTNACVNIEMYNNNTNAAGNDFAIDDISLYGPPKPITLSNTISNLSCPASSDGTIIGYAGWGVPPYTFALTGPTVSPSNSTGIFTDLAAGSYTLKVSDSQVIPDSKTINPIILTAPLDLAVVSDAGACVTSGSLVKLTASNAGPVYTWKNSSGVVLGTGNPFSVNPTSTTTYTVESTISTTIPPSNLITNGDFELGNTGFKSSYGFYPGNTAGAQKAYGIQSDPSVSFTTFQKCGDKTSGTGNMMIVDGSIDGTSSIWSQTLHVQGSTTYDFSFYAQNLTPTNFATFSVTIGGSPVILSATSATNSGAAPPGGCGWTQIKGTWSSGLVTPNPEIKIIDTNTNSSGNDFSLDNITFIAQTPATYNCPLTKNISVAISGSTPITGFSYTTPVCKTGTNPTPTPVTGFTAGGTYTSTAGLIINSATGVIDLATSTAGPYIVTYTVAAIPAICQAAGSSTAPITINSLPTITGTLSVCVGLTTTLTGSATADATTPWVSATPSVATISSAGVVTGISAGTSVITYKNSNGCTITATVTVNALPTISGTLNVCIGSTTTLTGSATANGTTPWVSATPSVATVSSAGVVTGVSAGTSIITYKNSNGCTITATVTVNSTPVLTINCGVPTVNSVTFNWNAIAGATSYNYTYTAGSSAPVSGSVTSPTTTLVVNGLTAGQNVAITLTPVGSSCPAPVSSNCVVSTCPLPTVDAISNIPVCANQLVTVPNFTSTPAGATFNWSSNNASIGIALSGSGNIPSFTAINATAVTQTATITVTGNNGTCTGPASTFDIIVNALPTITGTLNVCSGSTTLLSGSGTGDATTPWVSATPSVATINGAGVVTGVSAGTSIITYKNSNGCTTTATVTVNALPTITGTLSVCAGLTTTLTGSATADATNPWVSATPAVATISNGGVVTGVSAGTSIMTYKNSNGCIITATVTVNALPTITGTLSVCVGLTTSLTGSATADATTPWVSATPSVATISNTGVVTGISAGTSVITYKNSNGCTITATVTVNALPTISGTLNVCIGSTTTLTGSATADSTTPWISATPSVATISSAGVVTGVSAGTSIITYKNSNGCTITATVTVNSTPVLTISCGVPTVNSVTFNWNAIAGATSYNYSYVTGSGTPGSGSVLGNPTPTFTVNGLVPGENVKITITPIGSSCPLPVMGNCASQNCPSPTVDPINPNPIIVCANQTVTVPSFTSTPAGATFKWDSDNGAIGIPLTGSGNIPQFKALNATTVTQTAKISVRASDAFGCTGPTSTFDIIVNPLPNANISGSKAICSGTATNILFNGTPSTTVTYTINTGANQTIVLDALGNATLPTGNLAADTVYSLVSVQNPTTTCSQTQSGTATVTIQPLPTVAISGTITICSGSGANIDFVGTPNATVTYKINAGANQTIVLDASGNAQLATGTLTTVTAYSLVSVLDSSTTCSQTQTGTATIGINPLPTATISGSTTICSGTGTNVSFSGTPDAVVRYTKDGNPLLITIKLDAAGKATLATGNLTATTVYDLVSVSDANLCSQTQKGTVTITVNSIPTATISGTKSICSGTGTNITFNGTPNAKVTYTINSGANQTIVLDSSGSAILPTGNLVADAIYSLVSVIDSSLTCSQTLIGKATITVNPLPTVTISGTKSICSGTGTNITFAGTPNATVTYTINAGANQTIILDAAGNATLTTGNLTADTVYSLVSVRDSTTTCSQTQSGNAIITINPLPTVTISGTTSICSGTATTIVFTGTPDAIVTYTINAGLFQTLRLDAAGVAKLPTGNLVATTVYALVSLTNNTTLCYQTQPGSATVTIIPSPVVTATPASQVICSGEQTGILLTSTIANTTFSWTVLSQIGATGATANSGTDISQVLTATGTALGKVTYSVTSIANGCFGTPITVAIDVTPSPKATATPNAKSICSGETTAITLSSSTVGTTFDWNVVQVNVTGAVAGTGSTIAQTLKTVINKPGEVVYIITPILNGCPGLPISVVIKVNPIPDVTANPTQETICSGNAISIALTSNVVAATFSWTVAQTGVIGANSGNGNTIAQTLSTSGIIPGTVDYTITPMVNGCTGTPIIVPITVKPTPEVFGSAGTTICSGESPKINLSPNIVGTVFNWTVKPTGVMGASDGTGDTIDQNLVAGSTLGTVIYTVTPTLNGCTGKSIDIVIKVNPSPDLAIENGIVCIETTGVVKNAYTLNTNLSVATYDFEWFLNGVLIDGAVKNSYDAQSAGDYSVIITHKITGCISQAAHATVTETNPVNSLVATVTDAFTQNATITVSMPVATNTFLYKLDDGAFQDSNIFTGVSSGVHTIKVVDTDGCTDLTQELRVIDYPKYFTPNGDGFNDTWNIEGLNDQSDAYIYIYDRYGKFIKQITTAGQGWDGTHNGQALPATDYWFTVNYLETDVNKLFKAHFTLKR